MSLKDILTKRKGRYLVIEKNEYKKKVNELMILRDITYSGNNIRYIKRILKEEFSIIPYRTKRVKKEDIPCKRLTVNEYLTQVATEKYHQEVRESLSDLLSKNIGDTSKKSYRIWKERYNKMIKQVCNCGFWFLIGMSLATIFCIDIISGFLATMLTSYTIYKVIYSG